MESGGIIDLDKESAEMIWGEEVRSLGMGVSGRFPRR